MKNTSSNITYLCLALVLGLPITAHADAIIPYMVVPWGQVFLFPLVILVEALILRSFFHDKLRTMLYQSFIANLASTIIGAVLYVVTLPLAANSLFEWWFKGEFSSEAVRNALIAFLFAVVLWTISWLSETAVLVRLRKANSWKAVSFPAAVANFASYALLLTLAIWFAKESTSIEDHVDTIRNSSNIETYLKPDKRFPYIGFWKSHCTDSFGLAIEATTDSKYTVAFCGPGGCDKTDRLEHTSLVDDPKFRIIDANTIEVSWLTGQDAIQHRCGPRSNEKLNTTN